MQIEQLLCCVHETASLLLDDVARAEVLLGVPVQKYCPTDEQAMMVSDLAAIASNAAGEVSSGSASTNIASEGTVWVQAELPFLRRPAEWP